ARPPRARRLDATAQGRRRDPRHRRPRADVARARDADPRQLPKGRAAEDHDHAEQEQANARRKAAGLAIAPKAPRAHSGRAPRTRMTNAPRRVARIRRERAPARPGSPSRRISPRMLRSDFQYDLPRDLIAQTPLAERSASRLLVLDGATGGIQDRRFADLPELLREGDVLVCNDTRVLPARLAGKRTPSGGRVELLLERVLAARRVLVQLRASHMPKPGAEIELAGGAYARVDSRDDGFVELTLDRDAAPLWREHGEMPLPPYIERAPDASDRERYQTVFARTPGAVAAPTAGLHFDAALLAALEARGVERAFLTLHVGAGTFAPVRA